MHPKFIVSLTFRGFSCSPEHVETLVGTPAAGLVAKGQSRSPGQTPFRRSAASWSLTFGDSTRLDELIPSLLERVGKIEHLAAVIDAVKPEFLEVDVAMWILGSIEQEGGELASSTTLKALADLGATLSCGFYTRTSESQPETMQRGES